MVWYTRRSKCRRALQMKKACLTMRQRQMEELQSKGELPISMIAQPVNRSGALPPPMASVKRKFEPPTTSSQPLKRSVSSPESPEDPFTREVAVNFFWIFPTKSRNVYFPFIERCIASLNWNITNLPVTPKDAGRYKVLMQLVYWPLRPKYGYSKLETSLGLVE